MNRREAIAALMSLPAKATLTAARVEADDVIVVECPDPVSSAMAERIRQHLNDVWPGRKVVVLGDSLTLKIVRETT